MTDNALTALVVLVFTAATVAGILLAGLLVRGG